jgi:hypothetical protein
MFRAIAGLETADQLRDGMVSVSTSMASSHS